jgi:hypothetical protein
LQSAVKLAGDPNDPMRVIASMSTEELRQQIMVQLEKLGPILDLPAWAQRGTANRVNGGGADHKPAR